MIDSASVFVRDPEAWSASRAALHRVAAHVLARARVQSVDRSSLRVAVGGIATPAFSAGHRVVRTAGAMLIVEHEGEPAARSATTMQGATLAELAALAGADLGRPIDIGHDVPPLGDVHDPLGVDPVVIDAIAQWYEFSARLLDDLSAALPAAARPTPVRLWPEHFDVAIEADVTPARRVNVGGTPGDSFCEEPYLYVGPWGTERPGSPGYWNAPFGAVLRCSQLADDGDPWATAMAFLGEGLTRLAAE
jgi:hypothetical protein